MQYQVPQFIEIEDKIVGPLTLKQFIYIAIAFLVAFFSFFALKFFFWIIFALLVGSISIAFAFVKYNNRSFGILVRSAIAYFWQPRKYTWQGIAAPEITDHLKDLNLRLNTSSQPIRAREKSFRLPFIQHFRSIQEKYEVYRKTTGEREVARRVDYK